MKKHLGDHPVSIIGECSPFTSFANSVVSEKDCLPDLMRFHRDFGLGSLCGVFFFGHAAPEDARLIEASLNDQIENESLLLIAHTSSGVHILYSQHRRYVIADTNEGTAHFAASLFDALVCACGLMGIRDLLSALYYVTPSVVTEHYAINFEPLMHKPSESLQNSFGSLNADLALSTRRDHLGSYVVLVHKAQKYLAEIFMREGEGKGTLRIHFDVKKCDKGDHDYIKDIVRSLFKGPLEMLLW
jgi:hypothetical protein